MEHSEMVSLPGSAAEIPSTVVDQQPQSSRNFQTTEVATPSVEPPTDVVLQQPTTRLSSPNMDQDTASGPALAQPYLNAQVTPPNGDIDHTNIVTQVDGYQAPPYVAGSINGAMVDDEVKLSEEERKRRHRQNDSGCCDYGFGDCHTGGYGCYGCGDCGGCECCGNGCADGSGGCGDGCCGCGACCQDVLCAPLQCWTELCCGTAADTATGSADCCTVCCAELCIGCLGAGCECNC